MTVGSNHPDVAVGDSNRRGAVADCPSHPDAAVDGSSRRDVGVEAGSNREVGRPNHCAVVVDDTNGRGHGRNHGRGNNDPNKCLHRR